MINDLHRIAELLRISRRVLFITGAGVSAESGIPTFRKNPGLRILDVSERGHSCPPVGLRAAVLILAGLGGSVSTL